MLIGATADTLAESLEIKRRDANSILQARDNFSDKAPLLAQPVHQMIERMNSSEAAQEVASFGPMAGWDVNQVLRLINSFDSDVFEEVKEKCLELDFNGK
jgi:hypothetical protein